MTHPETVLEINLSHLTHNYTYLKNKVQPGVKMLAVVKAFGYGSDAVSVAQHLETLGVDYLAVAYAPEGVELRKSGITTPIMVLHPQPNNFELLLAYNLEPSLYSFRVLEGFLAEAKQANKEEFPIHIKYNSGLNRIGFVQEDVIKIQQLLQLTTTVKVTSILSHLAASEDPEERDFTLEQIALFEEFVASLTSYLGYTPLLHCSNTSGILNYPEAHFSMVRTGIGLYGYGNEARFDRELRPIATLKSVISQIHELEEGHCVGYNRGFIAEKRTLSATIPLGHADGIDRIYGHGKGFVTIHGQRAPILGNVCMDMIMVDVTNIACNEGDEVLVFGKTASADTLAAAVGTISYELITGIAGRIPRRIIE